MALVFAQILVSGNIQRRLVIQISSSSSIRAYSARILALSARVAVIKVFSVRDGFGELTLGLQVAFLNRLFEVIADDIHSCNPVLLLFDLAQLYDEHLSDGLALGLLIIKYLIDHLADLIEDTVFALIGIDLLQQVVFALLDAEGLEPALQAILLHVVADCAVNQRASMIPIFIDQLQIFAQRCTIRRRLLVIHMVESLLRLANFVAVDSSSVSSALALLERAVEPDDSIKTTLNQHLRRCLFSRWLNKKESFLHLGISLNWFKLLLWLIAAECFLKELGLSIASWEVHKNPANRISNLKLIQLLSQICLLCLKSLDLLLFKVFLLELCLN